jgi:hypothetical protein
MRKRLITVLVLLLVAGFTCAAYAEVQNVKVSGDIDIKGVIRNFGLKDWDGDGFDATYGRTLRCFVSTVRVKIDADLTDNVSTTVRLLNERAWNQETNANTDIDLDLASVTLKEFLYSPLSLTIGRQEIKFGNGLVIGAVTTNSISPGHGAANKAGLADALDDLSVRRAFDAIRATLNYDPLILDFAYAKIDENNLPQYDDVDLYGLNATYALRKDITLEGYAWQRRRGLSSLDNTAGRDKRHEILNTLGFRIVSATIKNLTIGLENAWQFGDHFANTALYPNDIGGNLNRKVLAFAGQLTANYVMPDKKFTPAINGSYTYLSGDKYRNMGDTYRGWDPMFKDQNSGTLFNKILGYSNCQVFNVGGSIVPLEDIKVSLGYYYLLLNRPFTNEAQRLVLSGVPNDPRYRMRPGAKHLAQEIDLGVTYDYTEDVQFGLNGGLFLPGNAFDADKRQNASQVIGSMKVTF